MVSEFVRDPSSQDHILDLRELTTSLGAGSSPEPTTARQALERLRRAGHTTAMAHNEDATLHCYSCNRDSSLLDVGVVRAQPVRTELDGQRAVVVAAVCPACGAAGALTLDLGPRADHAEVQAAQLLGVHRL